KSYWLQATVYSARPMEQTNAPNLPQHSMGVCLAVSSPQELPREASPVHRHSSARRPYASFSAGHAVAVQVRLSPLLLKVLAVAARHRGPPRSRRGQVKVALCVPVPWHDYDATNVGFATPFE